MDSIFTRLTVFLLLFFVDHSTSDNPSARTLVVQNKTCKISEFKCANDRCIQLNHYCNNKNDCGDSSDEPRYCTIFQTQQTHGKWADIGKWEIADQLVSGPLLVCDNGSYIGDVRQADLRANFNHPTYVRAGAITDVCWSTGGKTSTGQCWNINITIDGCNRTYYGVTGKTYDLELHRPKGDKIPFVCFLTFVASGGQYGELIQITLDSFTLGRFTSFTIDGCPDGALQIFESSRPHVGGSWCGTAWGPAIYYSETKRITVVVNLLRLSKIDSGYNFDYRMTYKFLKKNTAVVRYGGNPPPMFYNTTEPTVETEPPYYLGELIPGTYCSRIFSDCDKKYCRLQSPNFPGVYPRNLTCYYAVRQHEIPPHKHALIVVRQSNGQLIWIRSQSNLYSTASTRHLKIWDDCNDVQDYVTIYDGYTTRDPVILKFCGGGEGIPQTISSGHELLVEFSTSPYGTFLQASSVQALQGFQLEVEVKFVDEDSPTYMKQKHNCEFWIRGTSRGVVESPLHTLPANTTCLYHLQGLDTSVSPPPVPFRNSNDRYPDWSHAGVILPVSRYRVWLSLIKFNAAYIWDPRKLEPDTCKSYLNIWDGQLWTPTNCEGVLCGNLKNTTKSRSGATGKKNVTLLARYCKDHKPKSCEHSVFKNATHSPRPCSAMESFLTSGDSLTLELNLGDSTAISDTTFKALYEFVDLKLDGEPFTDEVCYRKFVAQTKSHILPQKTVEQTKFRSPKNIFLYGRGGAKNLSCIYRFEVNKDQRIKITITDVVLENRDCNTEIDKSTARLECIGNTSATLSFLEYPWSDVPGVPKNCMCSVDKSKLLPFTYISTTNVMELKFNVVDMTAAEDFDSLFFEGSWKAIQAPQCNKEMRYHGPSGVIVFSYPPMTPEAIHCASNLRVITPGQNKYIYLKILGSIIKYTNMLSDGSSKTTITGHRCETKNRIMVYTPMYSVIICPYDPYYHQDGFVEIFSEGWTMKSGRHHIKVGQSVVNTIKFDRLGKELSRTISLEFYGREEGEYTAKWLELRKRQDLPAYGLGYFMMRPDECQYQCPELDACINATVWCDSVEDCPSGVDESISNCSAILQLPPLYLFLGAAGVVLSSFVTMVILWKACRRKPKSILQARLKRLSSDTAILDDKDNIC